MVNVPVINVPPSMSIDVPNPRLIKTSRRYVLLQDSAAHPISKLFMFNLTDSVNLVYEVHRFIRELSIRKVLFDDIIVLIETVDLVMRDNAMIGYVNLTRYECNLYEFFRLGDKIGLNVAQKIIMSLLCIGAVFEMVGIIHRSLTPSEIMINIERNDLGEIIDVSVAICDFEDTFLSKINTGEGIFDIPDTPFYNIFSYGKETLPNLNNNTGPGMCFWKKYTGYAIAKCIEYSMQCLEPEIILEIYTTLIPNLDELTNPDYRNRLKITDFLYNRGIPNLDIQGFNDPTILIEEIRNLEMSNLSPPSTKTAAMVIIDALTGTKNEISITSDIIREILRIMSS